MGAHEESFLPGGEVDATDTRSQGLSNKQVLFVVAQVHTVGKVQVVGNDTGHFG